MYKHVLCRIEASQRFARQSRQTLTQCSIVNFGTDVPSVRAAAQDALALRVYVAITAISTVSKCVLQP